MLLAIRATWVSMVAAVAVAGTSVALAEESGEQHDAEMQARVEISVKNRNGVPLLTEVLKVLSEISTDPRFSQVLARQSDLSIEEADCLENARKDASGRVFDSANCLSVWPDATKATLPKEFEKIFPIRAGMDAANVFPAVQVTTFEFQLRMPVTQFSGLAGSTLIGDPDQLQPTPSFRGVLCNPKITFIESSKCEVKVISRLNVYPDDLYVSQTGYRVRLTNTMPPELAGALRADFLQRLTLLEGTPRDAVTISVLRTEVVQPEQQFAVAENSGSAPGADIEKFWRLLGTEVDQLNLGNAADAQPPTLMLFDKPDSKEPVLITDWLREITSTRTNDCSNSDVDSRHTDKAASLLFPEALVASLRRKEGDGPISQQPSQEWTGFLLGAGYFSGATTLNGLRWFERDLSAKPQDPLLALVIYSKRYAKDPDNGSATNAVTNFLNDASTLLVISAPQKSHVPGAENFVGPIEARIDADSLEANCQGHAWPACLGLHPRVLVVAPSTYPEEDGRSELADKETYLLGSSTVRMAAPGINVPILTRCEAAGDWNVARASGTSYSAPLVALLLSRLIQIAPEKVRDLPETAIWRVLATSKPITLEDGTVNSSTQFGRLDAGLALRGASAAEAGPDAAATLYEEDEEGKPVVTQAVVMPYLWNDQDANIDPARKYESFRRTNRNYITYLQPEGNRTETLEFNRLLRIVRRPGDLINGSPAFDIYFVTKVSSKELRSVVVRKRVRLGSGPNIYAQGFCRSNGLTAPDFAGATPGAQAQPACLYAWRKDTQQFLPLDLGKINDIVFPVLHIGANFPARISPADLKNVVAATSPWKDAFCATGPRLKVKGMLKSLQQPTWESVCPQ
jgi:hypothetical protein